MIILYLRIEACKVEAVGEIVFVDFAEVFVAAGGDKLEDKTVSKYIWKGCTQRDGPEPVISNIVAGL